MNRNHIAPLLLLVGCIQDPTEATLAQPAIATNAIATNAIATNAIATNAIATNAIATNAIATNAIATNGIVIGTVSDKHIALALEEPNARVFMRYLVSCALEPAQRVSWRSTISGARETFRGSLGLCPAWQTTAPDTGCRERVSACILARNNAFGLEVQFSLRGNTPSGPLALSPAVPPGRVAYGTNNSIASLARCSKWTKDAQRDCGWELDSIGVCTPGTKVALAAGAAAYCTDEKLGAGGSGDTMLRVCAGTRACDHRDAIKSVDDACGGDRPEVSFACPPTATYAVMKATASGEAVDATVGSTMLDWGDCAHDPLDEGDPLDPRCSLCARAVCEQEPSCCNARWSATCTTLADSSCRYPASEQRVYRWREGSFYGDLFGAANLAPLKPQLRVNPELPYNLQSQDPITGNWLSDDGSASRQFVGVAFPHMNACAATNWVSPIAYMERRVCAGPDPRDPKAYTRDCAANYVGRCLDLCDTLDAAPTGDHDAAGCADREGARWALPMTTLLTGPCEAVTDGAACDTAEPTPEIGE